jgi:hypothetical protein
MEEQNNTNKEEPKLTIADVILMANIISTASRRGAFEPTEFQLIGQLFEKIKAIVPTDLQGAPSQGSPSQIGSNATTEEVPAVETTNTSDEQPENQLNFDFAQGETVTQ